MMIIMWVHFGESRLIQEVPINRVLQSYAGAVSAAVGIAVSCLLLVMWYFLTSRDIS